MRSNATLAGLAVLLVALAVALFVVLQDGGSDGDTDDVRDRGGAGTGPSDPGGSPPAPPPVPEITVREGSPVGGVGELEVESGETVRFRVRSDEDAELHVHGYEIDRELRAGKPLTVSFPADLQGGYEIELHSHVHGDIPIASLTVSPG
jgi:hypothetical protein